jgi:Zn-dependent protease with chaperone function
MVSLVLFSYALALAGIARLLPGRRWTSGSPRLAIVTWQCLTASAVAAVIGGSLALLVPSVHFSVDLAEFLRSCVVSLRARYATPAGNVAAVLGGALAAALLLRVAFAMTVTLFSTARWRRRHDSALAILASPARHTDACVLTDDEPLVYCLPGAHRRIVVTTGALRMLSPAELDAVLCHERGHLRQRHHLVLAWTAGMLRAFPRSHMMRTAHCEVRRLVELLADDAATQTTDPLDLAGALLRLGSESHTPAHALGASDTAAAERVRRLIDPPTRMGRARAAVAYTVAAAILAVPIAALVGPALASANATYCPVHLEGSSTASRS